MSSLEFLPQVKGTIVEDLGGQPCEASQILTFLLSKVSPGACRYLTHQVLYNLCLQMYRAFTYRIGIEI
jgi:hypothetical protein